MEGAIEAQTVQLVLPPLTQHLPSYIDSYIEADETVLMALKEAMQNLIKAAEEEVNRQCAVKRLESYRFDRLSFTQKFVRFNSSTKNRVADDMHKSFRDLGICKERVVALHIQMTTLCEVMLPTARRDSALRAAHREWPRTGRFYYLPIDINTDTHQRRSLAEFEPDVDSSQLQHQHAWRAAAGDVVEDMGEGITRLNRTTTTTPCLSNDSSSYSSTSGEHQLSLTRWILPSTATACLMPTLLPCVKKLDGSGRFYLMCSAATTRESPPSLFPSTQLESDRSHTISPSTCPIDNSDYNSAHRLWAELNRLKIARGLKLRELGIVLNATVSDKSSEMTNIRDIINELTGSLIVAAQAHLELAINRLSTSATEVECSRISLLSNHCYAGEVFAVAGVKSWELTDSEIEVAVRECKMVEKRREAGRIRWEENKDPRVSGPVGPSMPVFNPLLGDKESGEVVIALVSQLSRLQRVLQEKEGCLEGVREKYKDLTVAQRYIRWNQSKTGGHIREEKVDLSEEVKCLRATIVSLKETLKSMHLTSNHNDFNNCSDDNTYSDRSSNNSSSEENIRTKNIFSSTSSSRSNSAKYQTTCS